MILPSLKLAPKLGAASLAPVAAVAVTPPTMADALASVSDPRLRALLERALAGAAAASGATVIDPAAVPPVMLWLSDDSRQAYVATAWKPGPAAMGDAQSPETYRGALAVAGARWNSLPLRHSRPWGFWSGRAPLLVAACRLLASAGWRIVHVANLGDAEARADAEVAGAPKVPAPARSRRVGPAMAPEPAPGGISLDLTGFEGAPTA